MRKQLFSNSGGLSTQLEKIMSNLNELNLTELMTRATTDVFSTMVSMELESSNTPCEESTNGEKKIVGSVGFAGAIKGVVYLHLHEGLAGIITETMLGLEASELGEDEINDVVGELSNMIGGNVKSRLCDAGFSCQLSVPSVARGNQFDIRPMAVNGERIEDCVFQNDGDQIRLVVALKNGETEA